ncbi:MAG: hypothetical protein ACK5P7_05170 [Bdellovibrio sp.]|jgi:hypothetical protein
MTKPTLRLMILAALILTGGGLFYFTELDALSSQERAEEFRVREQIQADQKDDDEQLKEIAEIESGTKVDPTPTPVPQVSAADAALFEFKTYTKGVLNEMPRIEDLRELPASELHGTPRVIRQAAVQLAVVADMINKNAALKPEALSFYQKCSLQIDFTTAVRALCLNRALRLYAELHKAVWAFDPSQIPPQVLELSKRL